MAKRSPSEREKFQRRQDSHDACGKQHRNIVFHHRQIPSSAARSCFLSFHTPDNSCCQKTGIYRAARHGVQYRGVTFYIIPQIGRQKSFDYQPYRLSGNRILRAVFGARIHHSQHHCACEHHYQFCLCIDHRGRLCDICKTFRTRQRRSVFLQLGVLENVDPRGLLLGNHHPVRSACSTISQQAKPPRLKN